QWTDLQHEIGGYPDLLVLHPRRPELMFVASAEKGPGSWRKSHFAGSRVSRKHRRRSNVANPPGGATRSSPAGVRGDVPRGLGGLVLSLRRDGHRRGVVQ